jgi:hypothetical protein
MCESKHGVITEFAEFSHDCEGIATLESICLRLNRVRDSRGADFVIQAAGWIGGQQRWHEPIWKICGIGFAGRWIEECQRVRQLACLK